MANDELMRLAERVEALATDWTSIEEAEKRDAIAADLRALAQRAPQNSDHKALGVLTDDEAERLVANVETLVGMGAGAWDTIPAREIARAFAQLLNKPGVTAPEGWALVPRVMTVEMDIAFCEVWFSRRRAIDDSDTQDAWDAALAAAPAPDHSAEAAGTARHHEEVMSSDPGRPAEDDAVDRGEVVEPSPRYASAPEALRDWSERMAAVETGQHVSAGSHGIADEPAPEAERAKGEAVYQYQTVTNGWHDLRDETDAERYEKGGWPVRKLYTHPAPPPAGQPENDALNRILQFGEELNSRDARTAMSAWVREYAELMARKPKGVGGQPEGLEALIRMIADDAHAITFDSVCATIRVYGEECIRLGRESDSPPASVPDVIESIAAGWDDCYYDDDMRRWSIGDRIRADAKRLLATTPEEST